MDVTQRRGSPLRRQRSPKEEQVRLQHSSTENIRKKWSDFKRQNDHGSTSSTFVPDLALRYDRALELAGSGFFHVVALVACGLVCLANSMVHHAMNYLTKAVECDFKLSADDKKTFNIIIYCSLMSGTAVWSVLGRLLGRRLPLAAAVLCEAGSAAVMNFASNRSLFMTCRFLWSMCAAGSHCLAVIFLAEVQPPRHRGAALSFLQIASILGAILVPLCDMSWRMAVRLSCLASFLGALVILVLPESHRFLLSERREKDAIRVLRTVFSWNTGRPRHHYPVRVLRDNPDAWELERSELKEYVPDYLRPRWYCLPVLIIAQFSIMYSYYTLAIWYEELVGHNEAFFKVLRQLVSSPPKCKLGDFPHSERQHPTPPPLQLNATEPPLDPCRVGTVSYKEQRFVGLLLAQMGALTAVLWLLCVLDSLGSRVFIRQYLHVLNDS